MPGSGVAPLYVALVRLGPVGLALLCSRWQLVFGLPCWVGRVFWFASAAWVLRVAALSGCVAYAGWLGVPWWSCGFFGVTRFYNMLL